MRTACLALALSLVTLPAAAVDWIGDLPASDRAAVERIAVVADEAWNARDAAGMSTLYTGDATVVVGVGAMSAQGAGGIRDYFTGSFARTPASLRHATTVDRIVVLAPDVAFADSRVALDQLQPDGSHQSIRHFSSHSVLVKREGEWKIHAVRAVPVAGR